MPEDNIEFIKTKLKNVVEVGKPEDRLSALRLLWEIETKGSMVKSVEDGVNGLIKAIEKVL